ncbi:MAG: lipopolysaccharide transport periplasmic protein LptA [Pseudomonadota bacterium]
MKPRISPYLLTLSLLLGSAFTSTAWGERADRDKPIHIEADRISVDDVKKLQTFEGKVILTQGSLQIRAHRLTVAQNPDGFQTGTAVGGASSAKGLAYFRQKREGKDEFIEGEAERIEHDMRNEKTQFTARAWIKNGQDEIRGNYIVYDALTEKYQVNSGSANENKTGKANSTKDNSDNSDNRVRAIIQPRKNNEPASGKSNNVRTGE